MVINQRTYRQLTSVFEAFQENRLSPHPLWRDLERYSEILAELAESVEDLEYARSKNKETAGDFQEEVDDMVEVVEELEQMKLKQWKHLMESFVVNVHYHQYLEE